MSCEKTDFCTSTGQDFEIAFKHLQDAGGAVIPVSGDVYTLAIRKNTSVANDFTLATGTTNVNGSVATLNLTTGEVRFVVRAADIALLGVSIGEYSVQYTSNGGKRIVLIGDLEIEEGLFA